jgi:hypothetical protein
MIVAICLTNSQCKCQDVKQHCVNFMTIYYNLKMCNSPGGGGGLIVNFWRRSWGVIQYCLTKSNAYILHDRSAVIANQGSKSKIWPSYECGRLLKEFLMPMPRFLKQHRTTLTSELCGGVLRHRGGVDCSVKVSNTWGGDCSVEVSGDKNNSEGHNDETISRGQLWNREAGLNVKPGDECSDEDIT